MPALAAGAVNVNMEPQGGGFVAPNLTTGDKVAADAPANTPATPSSWAGSNRLGSTDAN